MMTNRLSRSAPGLPMLALWVACLALVHCIQLDDGPNDIGGTGGASGAIKTWGTARPIHDEGTAPEVAVDPAGNAVAVWAQPGGILSSRYTLGGAWGTAETISQNDVAPETPTVAMDADGNAVAVWSQFFLRNNIYSNRYTSNGRWSAPGRLDDDDGDASGPRIAMSADGSAFAVWAQFDGAREDVWSSRYTRSEGWRSPERIETNSASRASGLQVAVDPNGNAVAVWAHSDGARYDIWSNRYTPSGGWGGTATRIEPNDAGDALAPQLAVDTEGNAVVVWTQFDGMTFDIWSNRYTPSSGWGTSKRIEHEDQGDASSPHIGVDANGNAVAVWAHSDGMTVDIWSNRYTPGTGWGMAERIEVNDLGDAREPRIAVDPSGNAVVVWKQPDGTSEKIWSNRYTPMSGWGAAERIDRDDTSTRTGARVAIDAQGNAVAVWSVFSSSRAGIWFNRLE